MAVAQPPIYEEIYLFLLSAPTPEQIINFYASDPVQERLEQLLDASRENRLSPQDRIELDEFERMNHFIINLKAYAFQQVTKQK